MESMVQTTRSIGGEEKEGRKKEKEKAVGQSSQTKVGGVFFFLFFFFSFFLVFFFCLLELKKYFSLFCVVFFFCEGRVHPGRTVQQPSRRGGVDERAGGDGRWLGLALLGLELVLANVAQERASQHLAKQWRSARVLSGGPALAVLPGLAVGSLCVVMSKANKI